MTEQNCELDPINNQIIFRFVEDTTKGQFNTKTDGGILVVENGHNQVDYARWAHVLGCGPDARDIAVGDIVLIENLRWTSEFIVNEESYWISTDADILAMWGDSDSLPCEVA